MSRTPTVPRFGLSAAALGLVALVLAALAALAAAPRAEAAFTTGKCAGADIVGRGASFARDAHTQFNFNFKNNFCIGTAGQGTINAVYEPLGSGAGKTAVTVRNDTPRFGMTDEPPTPAEVASINAGTTLADTNPNDNGKIHVVPAAVGAVAPLVNFPNGCDISLLPDASETAPASPTTVDRVRFTKTQFEKIWAGDSDADNWVEVFPALAGDGDCNIPITRVVRFDESGTTFTQKDYLNSISNGRGWLTTYATGANRTREWPDATFGARSDCPGADPGTFLNGPGGGATELTDNLTSGCANGNGALVTKLISTDGSVGYSDVSTARNASSSLAINPAGGDNDTYWTQVQNGSGTFTEPTADPNGFRTDGTRGANCAGATFNNVPASTLGNWAPVSGVNSPAGYGICTLTYGLVFDDNAAVWGSSAQEESKARTVKDYWSNVVSDGAQATLFASDYSPLPAAILAISRAGVDAVSWNKTGTGTQPDPEPTPVDPGPGPGPGPGPAPAPSNEFSIPRTKISSQNGTAIISVQLPGPGQLVMDATAKKPKSQDRAAKAIKVGRVVLNATRADTFELTLKPSAAAKRILRKTGKLKTNLAFTFTPTGGTPSTETGSVKLKLASNKGT